MNARFRDAGTGFFTEALSEKTRIYWNPIDDTASIDFESSRYLGDEHGYIARVESDSSVSITGEELSTREYVIDGVTYKGSGVIAFAKLLYNDLYNEQFGSQPDLDSEDTTP